jgi:WD40-like Beta Propeller Repeat
MRKRLIAVGACALLAAVVATLGVLGRQTAPADARFSRSGVISFIAKSDFESSLRQVRPGQNSGFIAPPDFAVSSYAWTPDGIHIAYVATVANQLWVQNGGMTFIADHVGTATWAPDGTRLAFTDETGSTLFVSDAAGTNVNPIAQGSGLKNPAWSPLGDAIA